MKLILPIVAATVITCQARVACEIQPTNEQGWHYRTKIPGYNTGIRDDKCWYIGPRMKPRGELYWPTVERAPVKPVPSPEFEGRWRGAKEGWDHQE